jgi:carboxyl-terminal processing protease
MKNFLNRSKIGFNNFNFRKQLTWLKSISLMTGTFLLVSQTGTSVKAALQDSPKTVVDEVWQIVNNEFVDRQFNSIDWQTKRQALLKQNYPNTQAAYSAIRASLKELGDPYTRFLEPAEFEELTNQTSGELSGVGIRLEIDRSTNQLTVVEPLQNSPADKAGIQKGDRILRINDKPTNLMSLERASAEIKGENGTKVSLELSRGGNPAFEVTLVRQQIKLPSVNYTLHQEGQIKVGYIKLDEFSSHAAEQMQKAIADLSQKQVSGFVLDLRGNPGGLLFSSVEIARMWMAKGAIVSTIDRKGGNQKFSANGKALTNLPLVILVDNYSASASEILTGALKENGRATVVGSRTYGKGTVQSVHSLSDGSGLAVTIARYYPPSGTDINHKGIAPDIQVDLTTEEQTNLNTNPSLIGTKADRQYTRAINILQTHAFRKPGTNSESVTIR